jgi:hypothetical protein
MENLYIVKELGSFEFWGTLNECQIYILKNQFKDSLFTIERA